MAINYRNIIILRTKFQKLLMKYAVLNKNIIYLYY